MRINQLPPLPAGATGAKMPVSYNGADYQADAPVNVTAATYQPGDFINTYLYGFGYTTNDGKSVAFCCLTPKSFNAGAGVTVNSVTSGIRVVEGGYLGAQNGIDVTSYVTNVEVRGNQLIITINKSTAWSYGSGGTSAGTIKNNAPVAGYLTVNATVT